MVTQLTAANRASLAGAGYAVTTFGLESHWIPLYTHKPLTDKKRGDVAFKARVGNPKTLNDGEAYYLARKAAQGFFPWLPGECLTHKFTNVEYVKDKLGGTRVVRHEPTMGCKWCREIPAAAAQPAAAPAETVTAAAAPAAEPPAGLTCETCGWKSKPGNRAGNGLRMHRRTHKRTTPVGVPAEGSAVGA